MITEKKIAQAAETIREHIIRTPLIHSPTLSRMFDASIYLKLENLQKTGSFKIRGAINKLAYENRQGNLSAKGVVAASAGNHAQGVAVAAGALGLPATIIMPHWTSISKQEAVKTYGGHIIIHGHTMEESLTKAKALSLTGMTMIHPFDDEHIIAGQASLGLEIFDDLPDADCVVVPVGGGGLIAGTALAMKHRNPDIRIIGVQAEACPSVLASWQAGRRIKVKAAPSVADGIGVTQPGKLTFRIMRRWVDKVVAVDETHINAAVLLLLERKKVLAEGAGAVGLAALLSGAVKPRAREKIVLLISGGNVDSPLLGRIVHQGLLKKGRIARVRIRMDDRPGTLARLLQHVALLEANVLHIHHDRDEAYGSIYQAQVELILETRNHDHVRQILKSLESSGYQTLKVVDADTQKG